MDVVEVEYADDGEADPEALLKGLKHTLGWWESCGLEFVAEKSGAVVVLEIKD